jgi:hypothetical protein
MDRLIGAAEDLLQGDGDPYADSVTGARPADVPGLDRAVDAARLLETTLEVAVAGVFVEVLL